MKMAQSSVVTNKAIKMESKILSLTDPKNTIIFKWQDVVFAIQAAKIRGDYGYVAVCMDPSKTQSIPIYYALFGVIIFISMIQMEL